MSTFISLTSNSKKNYPTALHNPPIIPPIIDEFFNLSNLAIHDDWKKHSGDKNSKTSHLLSSSDTRSRTHNVQF